MKKYLLPSIDRQDIRPLLGVTLGGGLIGGAYGVLHDLVTFAISPEYFTKLKFSQFQYADFGWGDQVFAATIGFIATGCVGLIAAWFLGRRLLPGPGRSLAYRQVLCGMVYVVAGGVAMGVVGFAYGIWRGPDADYWLWVPIFERHQITDRWSFVRVAYIHNAGYLGGVTGLLMALWRLKPELPNPAEPEIADEH